MIKWVKIHMGLFVIIVCFMIILTIPPKIDYACWQHTYFSTLGLWSMFFIGTILFLWGILDD